MTNHFPLLTQCPGVGFIAVAVIQHLADLLHLLTSLQFWTVASLPRSVTAYIVDDVEFVAVNELAAFAKSSFN